MSGYAQGDLTSLNGNFKKVYGDYEQAVPENVMLMKEVSFSAAERIGEKYVHGVELTRSHGWTMASSTATPNLNAPVSRESKLAEVDGYQSIMRSRISYIAANRAKGGDASFLTETQATVEELRTSHMERLEVLALYGQEGLAVASSVAGDVVTMTQGSWAEGIWAGAENMKVDVYSAAGVFRGTKQILSVGFDAKTLTLNSGEAANIIATDVFFYQGGSATTEYAGISKILGNTGLLFGINAATYALWAAPTTTLLSVPATLKDILSVDGRSRSRGGKGDKTVLVHHATFVDLVNDIESARTFSGSDQYKGNQIERGTQSLKLYSPSGVMTIKVHDCVKRGDLFGLNLSKWKRIGSTDPTFKFNGSDQYFFDLENVAALELRSFADNAWFCTRPATGFKITGIQPST